MDSWIVVAVLVLSVIVGAFGGWMLLGQGGSRRPRHQATDRPALAREGRHRGRLISRLRAPRSAPAGRPVHQKARRTHAKDTR